MPTFIDDPILGRLEWDHELQWWSGVYRLSKQDFRLRICSDSSQVITDPARRALTRIADLERKIKQKAANDLLQLYNDDWSDAPPISASDFIARLTSESICVELDGTIEIGFYDGGMFAGHSVVIELSPEGVPTRDAYIEG